MAACRSPIPPLGCLLPFFLFPSLPWGACFLSFFLSQHTGTTRARTGADWHTHRLTKNFPARIKNFQPNSLARHWARDWRGLAQRVLSPWPLYVILPSLYSFSMRFSAIFSGNIKNDLELCSWHIREYRPCLGQEYGKNTEKEFYI